MTNTTPPEPPPSGAWRPPPAGSTSHPNATSGVTITLGAGQLVTLAGGVLIVVSAWLDWIRPSRPFGPAMGFSAYDVPAQFLFRNRGLFESRSGPSLGLVIFVIGVVCVMAALVRPVGFLALLAGVGSTAFAIWYVVRLRDFADSTFRDLVGVGALVAAVGGVAAIVGGILTLSKR